MFVVGNGLYERSLVFKTVQQAHDVPFGSYFEIQYNRKSMSLSVLLDEIDNSHRAFSEETRKIQHDKREHVKRVLDDQDRLNAELEKQRGKNESWSKEIDNRKALVECEKQRLKEEQRKIDAQNTSLRMASIEQKKAEESVLRLVEEQKREKEEASKKILELELQPKNMPWNLKSSGGKCWWMMKIRSQFESR